jgi:hypothetical protein
MVNKAVCLSSSESKQFVLSVKVSQHSFHKEKLKHLKCYP